MAFGVLGTVLYDQATGERTEWSPCWLYAGAWLPFLAAIGFAYIEEYSPISVCLLIVTLILLVIATILAIPRLRACSKPFIRNVTDRHIAANRTDV